MSRVHLDGDRSEDRQSGDRLMPDSITTAGLCETPQDQDLASEAALTTLPSLPAEAAERRRCTHHIIGQKRLGIRTRSRSFQLPVLSRSGLSRLV
ncbi:uncharacterized protein V6R79_001546 [Siganus canaliculatus]